MKKRVFRRSYIYDQGDAPFCEDGHNISNKDDALRAIVEDGQREEGLTLLTLLLQRHYFFPRKKPDLPKCPYEAVCRNMGRRSVLRWDLSRNLNGN